MATVARFEELEAWQTARSLVRIIYDFSEDASFARDFALRDQIRRAAISVMSNIAEGFESRTQALFIDYLGRAKASAGEVRSQLYVAVDRRYITDEQFSEASDLADKSSRQLYRLIEYLESKPNSLRVREYRVEYDIDRSNV